VETISESDLVLAVTTLLCGVKRFTSDFVERWARLAMTPGEAWRFDETERPLTSLLYSHHISVSRIQGKSSNN
jgi:hypothetical protein